MTAAIEDYLDSGSVALKNVQAITVSVGGTEVVSWGPAGGVNRSTHVWSVAKSVLSTLVGIAIDEGLISSVDATVADLLPAYRTEINPAMAEVTLRRLLTMSAGCPSDSGLWLLMNADRDAVRAILRGCRPRPAEKSYFEYSSTGAHLVSAILAAALRQSPNQTAPRSVLDYAREKLFDPLDIDTRPAYEEVGTTTVESDKIENGDPSSTFEQAGFAWATDRQGIHTACCLLKLTAADLRKLGELYLNEGIWQGRRILSVDWVRQATAEQVPGYGFLWWTQLANTHYSYAARGSYGQLLVVVPDLRLVVAVTSRTDTTYAIGFSDIYPLVDEVIAPRLA